MKGFFKKSGIYFDTKVKKGSNNAVTSDAVAKAIEEGGGGGGGGTTDYNDLTNKPKINNVVLSGNKTLTDFSIASSNDLDTLEDVVNTKADKSVVVALDERVSFNTGSINTVKENIGNLTSLNTTDKTSLVNAINEVMGGGGSSSGVKYKRFAGKTTNTTTTVSGSTYVVFTEAHVKTWFDETPTSIQVIMAAKSAGTVVKYSIRNASNAFIMEQASSAITYDYVGVFYE